MNKFVKRSPNGNALGSGKALSHKANRFFVDHDFSRSMCKDGLSVLMTSQAWPVPFIAVTCMATFPLCIINVMKTIAGTSLTFPLILMSIHASVSSKTLTPATSSAVPPKSQSQKFE